MRVIATLRFQAMRVVGLVISATLAFGRGTSWTERRTLTLPGSSFMVVGPISPEADFLYEIEVVGSVKVDVFIMDHNAYTSYAASTLTCGAFDSSQPGVLSKHIDTWDASNTAVSGFNADTYIVVDNSCIETRNTYTPSKVSFKVSSLAVGSGAKMDGNADTTEDMRLKVYGMSWIYYLTVLMPEGVYGWPMAAFLTYLLFPRYGVAYKAGWLLMY